MASELLDTRASVCLAKGDMIIFTAFKNHVELQADSLFYWKHYSVGQDTLLSLISDSAMTLQSIKKAYLEKGQHFNCFDTLETFNYTYDDRADNPGAAQGEGVVKTREHDGVSVSTTYIASKWETFLSVISNGDTVKMKVAGERELADFFLYDVMGDLTPEIFIIRHVAIPSVVTGDIPAIEIEVYQIRR
ncbi:MAG: hypothetical protein IT233_04265 [Bacteroidia bacterium]|nr:hypothetical protein [Bacteroidia bacterium]